MVLTKLAEVLYIRHGSVIRMSKIIRGNSQALLGLGLGLLITILELDLIFHNEFSRG